ncbi:MULTISPECIES: histone-like nucleoid-structuring protein Lsr2 [Tsukamurella]|uniref:Lsr2 family protein n=1 Tax=Tsukamurella asaccharolytica TaxID=2592067 RepID=A0A5C5R8P2_9ACTN|nr:MULTISPECIES: Lsr2 family protein [Tsukamurella]KXP07933.1 nucleoid-associated protein Lsr2 [Tsukamurella tyrosinosolvens]TWS18425.1 Lsr2 family protein [Tsukamurella asaccharolytica]
MARKVTVTLTDDLDDTLTADETLQFALDGVQYEIDLSAKNAGKLRKALEPYKEAARRTGGRKQSSTPASARRSRATIDREQSKAIREWAKGAGHQVSERGRISQDVIDAYNAAK